MACFCHSLLILLAVGSFYGHGLQFQLRGAAPSTGAEEQKLGSAIESGTAQDLAGSIESDLSQVEQKMLQPFAHVLRLARTTSLLQEEETPRMKTPHAVQPTAMLMKKGKGEPEKEQKGQAKGGVITPAKGPSAADTNIQEVAKSVNALMSGGAGMPSKAEMPLMLGLMKSMYEDWKQKVGDANKAEKEQKEDLAKTLKDLNEKLKEHKLDQKSYDIISKYRIRARTISHKQFHNVLKICHSGMAQFKGVIQAMEEAKAGKKLDPKTAKALGVAVVPSDQEAPEVVLLQRISRLESWTRKAKRELHGIAVAAAGGPEGTPQDAAQMLAKLEGVAQKMRSLSKKGSGDTFAAIGDIAEAAEKALGQAKNASSSDPGAQEKILQAALGEKGLGSWMGTLASAAALNVEKKETDEAELLLGLLSQHQGIWSEQKMLETTEDFATHGNYAALELLRWAEGKKKKKEKKETAEAPAAARLSSEIADVESSIGRLEGGGDTVDKKETAAAPPADDGDLATALPLQLAKIMDARKAKTPTPEQREEEAKELEAFKLSRHLVKMQGTVEKVAKLVKDPKVQASLGVDAMRKKLQTALESKDPETMRATEKEVLAWAAKVSSQNAMPKSSEKKEDPNKGFLVLAELGEQQQESKFSPQEAVRSALQILAQ